MARLLVLSPEQKKAVGELVAFASQRENWFDPRKDKWVPGDRPEYTIQLESYRCCFTYDVQKDGNIYRHVSVSVSGNAWPNEIAVFTICTMFGFTGGKTQGDVTVWLGKDWIVQMEKEAQAINVLQKVES